MAQKPPAQKPLAPDLAGQEFPAPLAIDKPTKDEAPKPPPRRNSSNEMEMEGFLLFQEKFLQIRRSAYQTGCIAIVSHFLIAFTVVVGLFQITIASMYYAECPANDFIPQFLVIMGCLCILDMILSVLSLVPKDISILFFYTLMLLRLIFIGMIIYGFSLYNGIMDREMTHFCVDIVTDTLRVTLIVFAVLISIFYLLLVFNVITALALLRFTKTHH